MSIEETTIALLEIQRQLSQCGDHYLIRNTLRHKARDLAARFVDPLYEVPASPPLRDSTEMSQERVPGCPF